MTPLDILRKIYGFNDFRGEQAEIIRHVIAGGNAFVLMPTGGGKSLCYQIPALCRSGVTIVVSPLIALMQDQVDALRQLGVRAGAINSGLSFEEVSKTYDLMRRGEIDLVYVAPERLLMDDFLTLLYNIEIALFAIDEAHCVSQWGHDFRPHYAQLSLLIERFPAVPRIALTATADAPTRQDIIRFLGLENGKSFVAGFDRPNIHYSIVVADSARQQILRFIRDNHAEDSGIVYCLSRNATEDMAEFLTSEGFTALPYHAGLAPDVRMANQERFLREDKMIMVATIAFGMGIDKPDVRFVAHMTVPKNIEAYYQETGRAGRDGMPSHAYMVYSMKDAALQRTFIEQSGATPQQKRVEHHKLSALLGLCETSRCRRQVILEYFGDTAEPCGNCDTCQNPPQTYDGTVDAQKAISCVYRTGQMFGVNYVIDVLLGEENERIVRAGHNTISTFGIGKDKPRSEWQSIFRQLVAHNLLLPDVTGHGSLRITPQGQGFLKEKQSILLRRPPQTKAAGRKQRAMMASTTVEGDASPTLVKVLKSARMELAREQNVPPYVIFHDRTLYEMAVVKPANLQEMSRLHGMGEKKIERYGRVFLDLIARYGE